MVGLRPERKCDGAEWLYDRVAFGRNEQTGGLSLPHPLYAYSGDSGADESNGNGIAFAGGHWHVARPSLK